MKMKLPVPARAVHGLADDGVHLHCVSSGQLQALVFFPKFDIVYFFVCKQTCWLADLSLSLLPVQLTIGHVQDLKGHCMMD